MSSSQTRSKNSKSSQAQKSGAQGQRSMHANGGANKSSSPVTVQCVKCGQRAPIKVPETIADGGPSVAVKYPRYIDCPNPDCRGEIPVRKEDDLAEVKRLENTK